MKKTLIERNDKRYGLREDDENAQHAYQSWKNVVKAMKEMEVHLNAFDDEKLREYCDEIHDFLEFGILDFLKKKMGISGYSAMPDYEEGNYP
jgi:hypothetical protein